MTWLARRWQGIRRNLRLARQALRWWTPRHFVVAALAGGAVAVLIGVATVLIPNPVFARDIPPVWWNYPVWILTSALMGLLIATYLRPSGSQECESAEPAASPVKEERRQQDRKSTRLNSSHVAISYAVFCLKKKINKKTVSATY